MVYVTILDVEAQASKKGIQIIDKIQDTQTIFADKNLSAIILRNLISNAIKFTPTGGNVTISAMKQLNNNYVEISIADTGVGISKNKISELFRIDKNSSTQGTANEKGTGLGLILCKEFVEKQGGEIWVESELGKRSVFKFTLPICML